SKILRVVVPEVGIRPPVEVGEAHPSVDLAVVLLAVGHRHGERIELLREIDVGLPADRAVLPLAPGLVLGIGPARGGFLESDRVVEVTAECSPVDTTETHLPMAVDDGPDILFALNRTPPEHFSSV